MSTKLGWCIGPLLLLLALLAAKAQSATVIKIHSGWQFREVGKRIGITRLYPAARHQHEYAARVGEFRSRVLLSLEEFRQRLQVRSIIDAF